MNRLKELRKEKGLSQQALANELGVHYRTLQNWENGESQIKIENAKKLADIFEVSEGYLLGYTNSRFSIKQITEAISAKMGNDNKYFEKDILDNTIKIINSASFLDMDLETLSDIYFYNLYESAPLTGLNDLFRFFDWKASDYISNLEFAEPHQTDKIMQEIAKIDGYREQLNSYLDKVKYSEKSAKNTPKTIKIDIPQNILSDDKLKELSPEERKKYISDYLDDLSNALSNLADFASTTAGLTADQISKINDTLIQALAKLNNIKNKNKD